MTRVTFVVVWIDRDTQRSTTTTPTATEQPMKQGIANSYGKTTNGDHEKNQLTNKQTSRQQVTNNQPTKNHKHFFH